MKYIITLLALSFIGCGDDTVNKNMLVIGDSISLGYTPYLIVPEYEIEHAKKPDGTDENSLNTAYGLNRLRDWLNQKPKWDLITFNFGIHDMKLVNGSANETVENYKYNLRVIAENLKNICPRVVFIKTVVVPKNNMDQNNTPEMNALYAKAAEEIMGELSIPTIDLYSKSIEIYSEHLNPDLENDIHFTELGYQHLGEFISNELYERKLK